MGNVWERSKTQDIFITAVTDAYMEVCFIAVAKGRGERFGKRSKYAYLRLNALAVTLAFMKPFWKYGNHRTGIWEPLPDRNGFHMVWALWNTCPAISHTSHPLVKHEFPKTFLYRREICKSFPRRLAKGESARIPPCPKMVYIVCLAMLQLQKTFQSRFKLNCASVVGQPVKRLSRMLPLPHSHYKWCFFICKPHVNPGYKTCTPIHDNTSLSLFWLGATGREKCAKAQRKGSFWNPSFWTTPAHIHLHFLMMGLCAWPTTHHTFHP